MNDVLMYAKYNEAADKAVYALLDKLGNDEREAARGSYYGSLSCLFRHTIDGTRYFLSLYKPALAGNAAALKALSAVESLGAFPKGPLSEAQWKNLSSIMSAVDTAYTGMAHALKESDLGLPVQVEWYGGNPASVPLSFMLNQLVVHNTHHRGQISQILDSLNIENNFSGIDVSFII